MDVQRQGVRKRKTIRIAIAMVIMLGAAGGITYGVGKLQPALPAVDAGVVWPDTVKRGPMLRQVHGIGTLVPEDIVWISATTEGRIEKIHVQPGTLVRPETVVLDLSNPTLTEGAVAAEFDLRHAEATLADLTATLQSNTIDKQAAAAQITSDYNQAKIEADRDRQMVEAGLIPRIDAKLSQNKVQQLEVRKDLETKRLGMIQQQVDAQLAAQRVKIDQFKSALALRRQQVDLLRVRAGVTGVLQQLGNTASVTPLEAGQNVAAGSILAKIAQQDKLKAQIKITETEVKDIAIGQVASIDTRNGVIPGRVTRIDPAAVNGTVLVDVALTGALPAGARPDLSVDGTVDIERLSDVLFVGRPTVGQPNTTVTMFRYDVDGKTATRVTVKLGRASVSTIEVLAGLKVGDKVILSDMSAQDSHERIRLN